MSAVYFVSDLHLGHRSILRHTADVRENHFDESWPEDERPYRGGTTVEEHDDWVIERLLSVNPDKRTLWWILGDVAMDEWALARLDEVPGRKKLILGNHDLFPTESYLRHFEQVLGGLKKYGFWITHMPTHADELRGKPNLHGHCHHGGPNVHGTQPFYFNAAIEFLPDQQPVSLDWLRTHWLPDAQACLEAKTRASVQEHVDEWLR